MPAKSRDDFETLLKVEPITIQVGLGLIRYVEGGNNSPLIKRISAIRRQFASELGYVLPPVRITDNLQLKPREYVVLLKGCRIAKYEIQAGSELAIQPASGP